MKNIRIALAIQECPLGANENNLEKCIALSAKAAASKASIILFPEMNITGYSSGPAILRFAESIPGKTTDRLCNAAKKHKIAILAGLAEKAGKTSVYSSHVAAMPDGTLHCYRKIHIAPPERETFIPGNVIETFENDALRFGIQLCYDAHFPELTTAMALKGVDIIFFPHASPRGSGQEKFDSWMRHMTARAFDNGIFVAACNQVGNNHNGLYFPGIALAVGPDGHHLTSTTQKKETLLMVDLESGKLERVRNHPMRYFLPNRRGDLY